MTGNVLSRLWEAQAAGLSFAVARREPRQAYGWQNRWARAHGLRCAQMHSASGRTRQASGLCSPELAAMTHS